MTLILDADSTTRGLDEQFLELIYADPDWVQAEFDEIVALESPSPPPAEPGRIKHGDRRPYRARPRTESNVTALSRQPHFPALRRLGLAEVASDVCHQAIQPKSGEEGDRPTRLDRSW